MKSGPAVLLGVLCFAVLHMDPDEQITPEGYGYDLKGSYGRGDYGRHHSSERLAGEYDEPSEGRRKKYQPPYDYHYDGRDHRDDYDDFRTWNGENYLLTPATSCAGKLPPACQTFDSAYPPQCNTRSYSLREQGSTEGYYGGGGDDYQGGDKPYKKQALQMFAPVCASPGAAYAWARQCVVTAQAGSTCTGAALCQPGGAITTALATCTATGWTVTNGCAPAACALTPVLPAGSNIAAFTACQVPGALGQVCATATASCTGARTPTGVAATCLASGWQVQGCCQPADFNAGALYTSGVSIGGQQGWTTTPAPPAWDETIQVVDGRKVWQLSNAVFSTGFSNQPTSYVSCQVAGEPGSNLWNDYTTNPGPSPTVPGFPTTNKFYWRVQFKSAVNLAQQGLVINLASVAKQSSWRMTYLRIRESTASNGLELGAFEAIGNLADPTSAGMAYPFTIIATGLSYADVHTLETEITFVPGININGNTVTGNDIVKVYLNGNLIYTGSTWEALYYVTLPGPTSDVGTIPNPRLQAVNALMFRQSAGPNVPGTLTGNGLLFQEVLVGNSRN